MAKRTTKQLVDDLLEEARSEDVIRAGLVVGYDDRSEVVWSSDPEPLQDLNRHLRDGGLPVGIARLERGGLHVTTLPELEGARWADRFLVAVSDEILRGLARHLGVEPRTNGPLLDQLLSRLDAPGPGGSV